MHATWTHSWVVLWVWIEDRKHRSLRSLCRGDDMEAVTGSHHFSTLSLSFSHNKTLRSSSAKSIRLSSPSTNASLSSRNWFAVSTLLTYCLEARLAKTRLVTINLAERGMGLGELQLQRRRREKVHTRSGGQGWNVRPVNKWPWDCMEQTQRRRYYIMIWADLLLAYLNWLLFRL